MIVDRILDRKDNLHYNSQDFYRECLGYGEVGENIVRAMDEGTEADVKEALKQYIQDNEYNPLLMDYIERVNWVRGTEPTVEKAAAEEFNAACRAREKVAENMSPIEGKDSYFAFEVGVLLPREDPEFDFYAINNPELPYGFYDENQGMFLSEELGRNIRYAREYVKNGNDTTYGIISFQGLIDVNSDGYRDIIDGEYDIGNVSYTFFNNANEIVWSCCKIDGQLIEGFLEKEIKALGNKKLGLDSKNNEFATHTVKARDIKPGMRTETGLVIDTKKAFAYGEWGIEVNSNFNGRAVFDWFPEDKDVTVFEDFAPEKKASIDKQINVAVNKKSSEKRDVADLKNNLER